MTVPTVILESEVYTIVTEMAQATMPGESIGLLAGTMRLAGAPSITVKEALPMREMDDGRWTMDDGRPLEQTVPHSEFRIPHSDDLVGWFYADPCAGIFPPRFSLAEIQSALPEGARLFLLVNPSSGQGAFYQWDGRRYLPTNGFYEVIRNRRGAPVVPWNGELHGARSWLAPAPVAGGRWAVSSGQATTDNRQPLLTTYYALRTTRYPLKPVIRRRSPREALITVGGLLGVVALLALLLGKPQSNQGNALIPEPTATEVHLEVTSPGENPNVTLSPLPTQTTSMIPAAQPTSAPTLPAPDTNTPPGNPTGGPRAEQTPAPVEVTP